MNSCMRKVDRLSDDSQPMHFGNPTKDDPKISASPINGYLTLSLGLVCFALTYTTAVPVFTGTKNTFASVTSGSKVNISWSFSEPMSYESFGVVPYLLFDHNSNRMTFNDQDELVRLQRIFTFGTVYWADSSDGSRVREFEPFIRCADSLLSPNLAALCPKNLSRSLPSSLEGEENV